jgi:hypothetical protein
MIAAGASASAHSSGHKARLAAQLTGFQEVPALNSPGSANFSATASAGKISFELQYAHLTGAALFAHIHVGQRGVSGGVAAFLCGGGGKPACPTGTSGKVTGVITAADVVGPTTQGFTAGDLAALERAIKAGVTYANIHTPSYPAGEIRGQVHKG